MATIDRGEWAYASIIFIVANVGIAASFVFYDSLLPHIARPDEMDRVSTAGYAIGYLGGGLLLVVNLLWILMPTSFGIPDTLTAIRLSFVSVAVWWLVFSIPLFRGVPEPARALEQDETGAENPVRAAFVRLRETFQELRGYRQAFLMLVAFLLYNDGIQTIIRMATIYGAEIGIDRNARIAAFVVVQFVGVPFSFLFGALRGAYRRQDVGLRGARGLHGHQHPRLLHDDGVAVLCAGVPRRHGAGRQPGAQPVALRAHDSKAQVVGVLRLLFRLREVRRYRRAGALCSLCDAVRIEPRGRTVGDSVLRGRRAGPYSRQCRRGRSSSARFGLASTIYRGQIFARFVE